MFCPYSPSCKNKAKCELYEENSFDCNKASEFENCGKFRMMEHAVADPLCQMCTRFENCGKFITLEVN